MGICIQIFHEIYFQLQSAMYITRVDSNIEEQNRN